MGTWSESQMISTMILVAIKEKEGVKSVLWELGWKMHLPPWWFFSNKSLNRLNSSRENQKVSMNTSPTLLLKVGNLYQSTLDLCPKINKEGRNMHKNEGTNILGENKN